MPLSDGRNAASACFYFPLMWNILFQPLTFSLWILCLVRSVSCMDQINESYFLIYSSDLCLCIAEFRQFVFRWLLEGNDLVLPFVPQIFSLLALDFLCTFTS